MVLSVSPFSPPGIELYFSSVFFNSFSLLTLPPNWKRGNVMSLTTHEVSVTRVHLRISFCHSKRGIKWSPLQFNNHRFLYWIPYSPQPIFLMSLLNYLYLFPSSAVVEYVISKWAWMCPCWGMSTHKPVCKDQRQALGILLYCTSPYSVWDRRSSSNIQLFSFGRPADQRTLSVPLLWPPSTENTGMCLHMWLLALSDRIQT